jgi:hypothetical protein
VRGIARALPDAQVVRLTNALHDAARAPRDAHLQGEVIYALDAALRLEVVATEASACLRPREGPRTRLAPDHLFHTVSGQR